MIKQSDLKEAIKQAVDEVFQEDGEQLIKLLRDGIVEGLSEALKEMFSDKTDV